MEKPTVVDLDTPGAAIDGVTYYALLTVIKANLRQFSPTVRRQVLDLAMTLADAPPTLQERSLLESMKHG